MWYKSAVCYVTNSFWLWPVQFARDVVRYIEDFWLLSFGKHSAYVQLPTNAHQHVFDTWCWPASLLVRGPFCFLYNILLLVVISCFVFFRLFGHFVDYGVLSWKKIEFEILYHLCHRPCFSYEKLGWFCVRLVYKFLVTSFSYEFLVRETWTVCHQQKK